MVRCVPVFFDFACPFSYASRPRELRAERELDVRFVYVPWEIHPDVPPEGELDPETAGSSAMRRFAETNGGRFIGQPRRHNTRRLLAGVAVAQAHGRLAEYVDEGFRAYRERNENVHEEAVLRQVAKASGLDADAFVAQVTGGTWEPWLRACDAWAEKLRVRSTVTYVLPGAERLEAVRALKGEEEFRELLEERLSEGSTGSEGGKAKTGRG